MGLAERRITRIEVETMDLEPVDGYPDAVAKADITFFFSDTGNEPFSSSEFILESKKRLIAIETAIDRFNELNERSEA